MSFRFHNTSKVAKLVAAGVTLVKGNENDLDMSGGVCGVMGCDVCGGPLLRGAHVVAVKPDGMSNNAFDKLLKQLTV